MSVTWTPVRTTHEADSLDHLRAARALLEEAIVELDLASKLAGADQSGESIDEVRSKAAEALRRCVELIETEKIHYDTAMEYAPSREALGSAIKGIKTSGQSLVGRGRR